MLFTYCISTMVGWSLYSIFSVGSIAFVLHLDEPFTQFSLYLSMYMICIWIVPLLDIFRIYTYICNLSGFILYLSLFSIFVLFCCIPTFLSDVDLDNFH